MSIQNFNHDLEVMSKMQRWEPIHTADPSHPNKSQVKEESKEQVVMNNPVYGFSKFLIDNKGKMIISEKRGSLGGTRIFPSNLDGAQVFYYLKEKISLVNRESFLKALVYLITNTKQNIHDVAYGLIQLRQAISKDAIKLETFNVVFGSLMCQDHPLIKDKALLLLELIDVEGAADELLCAELVKLKNTQDLLELFADFAERELMRDNKTAFRNSSFSVLLSKAYVKKSAKKLNQQILESAKQHFQDIKSCILKVEIVRKNSIGTFNKHEERIIQDKLRENQEYFMKKMHLFLEDIYKVKIPRECLDILLIRKLLLKNYQMPNPDSYAFQFLFLNIINPHLIEQEECEKDPLYRQVYVTIATLLQKLTNQTEIEFGNDTELSVEKQTVQQLLKENKEKFQNYMQSTLKTSSL